MKGNHENILQRNQVINKNILHQAALHDVKNIFCFGSHTMYSPGIKKNESNLLIAETPNFIRGYADSKRLLLQECKEHSLLGFNYKMLVLPSIYGPFNLDSYPKQMLNSIILRAIRLKKEKQIPTLQTVIQSLNHSQINIITEHILGHYLDNPPTHTKDIPLLLSIVSTKSKYKTLVKSKLEEWLKKHEVPLEDIKNFLLLVFISKYLNVLFY